MGAKTAKMWAFFNGHYSDFLTDFDGKVFWASKLQVFDPRPTGGGGGLFRAPLSFSCDIF